MNETLYNALMSGQIDTTALTMKIQQALDTCAEAGFICTTPDNINTFALIVGGLGIVIGILACLGFQYHVPEDQRDQATAESPRTIPQGMRIQKGTITLFFAYYGHFIRA